MSENEHNSGANPNSRAAMEKAAMQDEQVQDVHAQLLREREEPHEGITPVPIFLIFLFAALCFFCGVYFVKYSGNFQWNAYSPNYVAGAPAPKAVEISLFDRGAKVFRAQCAQCHQVAGTGIPGVYPPLAGSEWVLADDPSVPARILLNGLSGPVEVKGNTYNGSMPSFGPSGLDLSEKELAGVITYIRHEWGNEASEVTVEMITEFAEEYSARSTPWTSEDLKESL
jgi:mono/diheme cytochrome c family protein